MIHIFQRKGRQLRIELASLEDVIKQADFIVHTPYKGHQTHD